MDSDIGPVRTTAAATLSAVAALMPAFFVGASGVFLREALGFDEAGLGIAIAVFFGVSALSCVPGGMVAERIGAGRALTLVGIGSAAAMLGIATLADSLTRPPASPVSGTASCSPRSASRSPGAW